MKHIGVPPFFIIDNHFRIPLGHIVLAFVIPGPFHHFTHMVGPVQIDPHRPTGSYFFQEFCFQDGIINFVVIQDRYFVNPGSPFLGQGNGKIMDIDLAGKPFQAVLKIFCPGHPARMPNIFPVFYRTQLKGIGIEVHVNTVQ